MSRCTSRVSITKPLPNSNELDGRLRSGLFIVLQAVGGFLGPGFLTGLTSGNIELSAADDGSALVSGVFERDDGAALPSSASVFFYLENTDQSDDFARGQEALVPSTGEFTTIVTDIPEGNSTLWLSFVVADPAEALDVAGADTVFALDVSNDACVSSLTITLEWPGATSDLDLWVFEPSGRRVGYSSSQGVSAVCGI